MIGTARPKPWSRNREPDESIRSITPETSTWRGRLTPKLTRRASRLSAPRISALGSSSLTTAAPPGGDLAEQLGLRASLPERDLGGEAQREGQVGGDGRLERDPLEASGVDRVGGDLDHAGLAFLIDHIRQDRRQSRGASRPGPGPAPFGGARADAAEAAPSGRWSPSDQPLPPDQAASQAGGLEDRADHQAGDRLAVRARHAQRDEPLGGIAGQRVADPSVGRSGVVDDHLKPAGFWTGLFDHHARRAPVERLADEAVPVVAGGSDRDEHLARIEPSVVVGAARDLPVGTSHELSLGEQPSEAHRGDSPLRQTIDEPACHWHRLLALPASRVPFHPRLRPSASFLFAASRIASPVSSADRIAPIDRRRSGHGVGVIAIDPCRSIDAISCDSS